jgi:hypothetical protein
MKDILCNFYPVKSNYLPGGTENKQKNRNGQSVQFGYGVMCEYRALSPSQVLPKSEKITTIESYIQVFILCGTEGVQVNYIGSCLSRSNPDRI